MHTQRKLSFDEAKVGSFAEQMVGVLNGVALALMTSNGHRKGLFDTLDKLTNTACATLAENANLAERYVREWLGAMVTTGVVECDSNARTYTLLPENAAFLTTAAKPDSVAVACRLISIMTSVEEEMVARFRDGGGTRYHDYCRFQTHRLPHDPLNAYFFAHP